MTDTAAEFERATDFEILDEDIDKDRAIVGLDQPSIESELMSVATPESIKNFAWSYGDDNPLFCDPDYAAQTRWGGQVAPQIMAAVLNAPLNGDRLPKDKRGGSYRGVHAFVSGGTWEWFRRIRPGDQVFSTRGLESIEVKESEFAGKSVIKTLRDVKFNQHGDVLGVYRTILIHTGRKKARERGKYKEIPEPHYSDADMDRIEELYAAEERRGSTPLYWEDVKVGDTLPTRVKGPLTTTDIIVFHSGGYGFVPYGLKTGRLAHVNRQRIKPFYVKNDYGIPDVAQRVHWDSAWAQAIGNPRAYDYGVLRECWMHHLLTDWMGDDALVVRQHDQIRKFNYVGDTHFLSGVVTAKREEGGAHLVDLSISAKNQRDEETVTGEATIALPSSSGGAVLEVVAPNDLRAGAAQAIANHGRRRD